MARLPRRAPAAPLSAAALLAAESARFPAGDAGVRVALLYPSTYDVALASLGFQAVWAALDALPGVRCERVVLPAGGDDALRPNGRGARLGSLESGRALADFDLVGVSVTDELDLGRLALALEAGGLAALADERPPDAPPVLAGGPLTQSNPLPLAAFADAVVIGDAEGLLAPLVEAARAAPDRAAFAAAVAAAALPGVLVPAVHGDALPPANVCSDAALPAAARVWTPHAALPDMFLVEISRGCPRRCAFCLSRRALRPERRVPVERVWERVPAAAPRIGFVGSAVSDHPGLPTLLERAVARGQGVGLSSVRADRVDDALLELLVRGGLRTLTVAADALSERLRASVHKGVREEHLVRAAELARARRLPGLKLYTLVGLPGEEDADLDEWLALCERLRAQVRLTVSVNPFVPKRGTPLEDAPLAPLPVLERRLTRLTRALARAGVQVRALSPKWAWVQWRLSHGGRELGRAARAAARAGGGFAAWRRALEGTEA